MAVGLFGMVVPIFPGVVIIWAAVLIHGFMTGFATLALSAGVRLPDATTCALRAAIRTDKRPDMVSLLAECYHRRGYHQRAVNWIKEALAKEPREAGYLEQLERYESRLLRYRRGYGGN